MYEEISYLAYHFHWPPDALLDLPHRDRARYVAEVGRINIRINQGG
ncbi:hypothetical protein GCM10009839_06380 [Catenulispora yoronensis]|uniref:DUF6760 domain-containing protein n=1 Tax=Catenulispora yoronensis TaxID=450799 RepID=A0ABN2TMP0_9ACTN